MKDEDSKKTPRKPLRRMGRGAKGRRDWFTRATQALDNLRVHKEERAFLAARAGHALRTIKERGAFARDGYQDFDTWVRERCGFLSGQAGRYIHVARGLHDRGLRVKGKKLSFTALLFIIRQREALQPVLVEHGSGHTALALEEACQVVSTIADDDEAAGELIKLLALAPVQLKEVVQGLPRAPLEQQRVTRRLTRSLKGVCTACTEGVELMSRGQELKPDRLKLLQEQVTHAEVALANLRARLAAGLLGSASVH